MSPRRMDISSLLRAPSPSPPPPLPPPQERPRTIDALLHHSPPQPCPPFLGLDALVHVASEERRRITAAAASSPPVAHDHDRPPRHLHHLPSTFQPSPRPHKRTRDAPSPSPEPRFPLALTSPTARHHPSVTLAAGYPTLRRHPVDPARSPADACAVPFSHQPPPSVSPHRHSPQHLRSQHHSSPVHASSFVLPPADADPMSPRYGHIHAFSNDLSSRDSQRPDLPTYHPPPRDPSTEWLVSDSRTEHARYEHPKLSPLSPQALSPDDDKRHVKSLPESVAQLERMPSHPLYFGAVTDNAGVPTKEADLPTQPPERHPIRVWEEPPTPRDTHRRISSTHMPDVIYGPTDGRTWLGTSETLHGGRTPKDDRETALQQHVAEDVPAPPSSTCEQPSPHRAPTPASLAPDSRTPDKEIRPDPQPWLPTPMQLLQSKPRTLLPQAPPSNPRSSASPIPDAHPKNFETQSRPRSERSDMHADANTIVPLTSFDSTMTDPSSGKTELMPEVVVMVDCNPLSPQPSSEPLRLAKEPGTSEMPAHLTHTNASQRTSRSPSPRPLPTHPKDAYNASPDDKLVSHIELELPPRSLGPEHTSEREPPAPEQTAMDVDEELLSLVEDRPVRVIPVMPKTRTGPSLPLPTSGHSHGVGTEALDGPSLAQHAPKGPLAADEEKDRASMPPPTAARNKKAEKDKVTLNGGTATGSRKKKDGSSKPATKPKQPPKPRTKPVPKPKTKPNVADPAPKCGTPKGTVNVNARSRSTSVIPGAVDDIVPEPEADQSDKEDDKLYCVCKTRYDEDRVMIACDRCDEWFHTLCVNIPDLEIDLVDQFICPPCIYKHPHLRTTWKRRCLFGLKHENPSLPEACHKPSRGAFSKYCSDDCGVKYMRVHITQWEKSGGVRGLLWEYVKNAPKREGVVIYAETNGPSPPRMDVDNDKPWSKPLESAAKQRADREVSRLNARLEEVVKEREFMKRELDMVLWRESVVELASERAGKVDECGWDQRLCFGEEEWADFGPEVLESYEERVKVESGDDAMSLDAVSAMHGEWWCTGKRKCERHAGWQKLRAAEVSFDKETKEGILLKLTTREREIRKCIEDILCPQPTSTLQVLPEPSHPRVQVNGSEKPHPADLVSERGKKRSS